MASKRLNYSINMASRIGDFLINALDEPLGYAIHRGSLVAVAGSS